MFTLGKRSQGPEEEEKPPPKNLCDKVKNILVELTKEIFMFTSSSKHLKEGIRCILDL